MIPTSEMDMLFWYFNNNIVTKKYTPKSSFMFMGRAAVICLLVTVKDVYIRHTFTQLNTQNFIHKCLLYRPMSPSAD